MKPQTPTPHIEAQLGDIAPIVLMPGDPLRAKYIAENFLENYKQVNAVRGMLAYTGYYKNKKITVMGSGMGNASIGIYSYELFNFYNVDVIIRVGSCGAYLKQNKLGDIIIADEAFSYSNYAELMGVRTTDLYQVSASQELVSKASAVASKNKIRHYIGWVNSKEAFYSKDCGSYINELIRQEKIIAAEMESYALYTNAIKSNKKALTILTVSDSFHFEEELTPQQKENGFNIMFKIALGLVEELN